MGVNSIVKRNRWQLLVVGLVVCLALLWASVGTVFGTMKNNEGTMKGT